MEKENEKNIQEEIEKETEEMTQEAPPAEEDGDALSELKREKEELFDQYLRLKADFENYKRRSEKERMDIISRSLEELLERMLPVLDNFDRAVESESAKVKAYKEGVELVYEQLMQVLVSEGLKSVKALDEEFDPEYHHAVVTECIEEKKDNVILEVLQTGYLYKDRLLRPAMVKVNKH
jgi:molecular chaperone GrpE